jgi:hypothetical protein
VRVETVIVKWKQQLVQPGSSQGQEVAHKDVVFCNVPWASFSEAWDSDSPTVASDEREFPCSIKS